MIKSVKVTNHLGEVLTMDLRSPEKSGLFVRGITGLGPTKSAINTVNSLTVDGSFYNSSRLEERNVVFSLGFLNHHATLDIEAIRRQTYRYFPTKKLIRLEFTTDGRVAYTNGYVESNEPDIFSRAEGCVISVICPDAFLFDTETINTVFSGVNASFEFPFENPSLTEKLIAFGSVFISSAKSIFYTGEEETGFMIYVIFTGAVNNLAIHNATSGQSMIIDSAKVNSQTGSNFKAGDYLVINTKRGEKSIKLIRAGYTYNLINALSSTAIWLTLNRGDNVITFTAQSGLANMQFSTDHQIVYGGL